MAAPPPSSLSVACRAIVDFVKDGLHADPGTLSVLIGNPAEAVPKGADPKHVVNLFFYRIEPSGFFPDWTPTDPWLIRLHCLITAFGVTEENISAGEIDLRLLGEVIRLFHETPVLKLITIDGQDGLPVRLEAVFHPLEIDALNHIWATQPETNYRPSVAYEFSLSPIVPHAPKPDRRLVGAVGLETHASLAAHAAPFAGSAASPPVVAETVDTESPRWAPRICFVTDGACARSLSFALDSPALATAALAVWIAGQPGTPVDLRWETWGNQGFEPAGTPIPTSVGTPGIDPEAAAGAPTTNAKLPFTDRPGQAVLYAVRTATIDSGATELRSNPLLVSLYRG